MGLNLKGELLILKEKKRIPVELDAGRLLAGGSGLALQIKHLIWM
ncbi:MAG: hypothetical protein QMD71_09645 [bacterium]|nr:hypothetical protein [bacterium]